MCVCVCNICTFTSIYTHAVISPRLHSCYSSSETTAHYEEVMELLSLPGESLFRYQSIVTNVDYTYTYTHAQPLSIPFNVTPTHGE